MPEAGAGRRGVSWCCQGCSGTHQTRMLQVDSPAPSLAQSLNLFGNQLLEVKIKGGTLAMRSGVSNPCVNSDFSPFFTLSTAKKKEKKKLVLFSMT